MAAVAAIGRLLVQQCKLTYLDFFGIQVAGSTLQTLQTRLNPAGSSEDHPCLHLDVQEDVAGMS